MTISEMHEAIKIELDKSNSLSYPSFLATEIDYWLNRGQLKVSLDTINGSMTNPTNVTNSVKNIEDMKSLLKSLTTSNTLSTVTNYPNVGTLSTPADFLHYSDSVLKNTTNQIKHCKLISREDKFNFLSTEDNTPWIEHPLVYIDQSSFRVIVDPVDTAFNTITNNSLIVEYYRVPSEVSLSEAEHCELPAYMHYEVVATAANLMLENIESPRYPNNTQQLKDTL